jgi:hypothetical protein
VGFTELVATVQHGEPVRLALVELAEGPIVMCRADPGVRPGDRVAIRFDDSSGPLLPVATATASITNTTFPATR